MKDFFQATKWNGLVLLAAITLCACTSENTLEFRYNNQQTDAEAGDSASSTDEGGFVGETDSESVDTHDAPLGSDEGDVTDVETEGPPADTESAVASIDCASMDTAWADIEQQVVDLINKRRIAGFECAGTAFAPVAGLEQEPRLTCAARYHCADMTTNDFVGVNGSDRSKPAWLMDSAGYDDWHMWGILVLASKDNAVDIVDALMGKQSRCKFLFNDKYTDIGVGVRFDKAAKYKWYTTVYFGQPN